MKFFLFHSDGLLQYCPSILFSLAGIGSTENDYVFDESSGYASLFVFHSDLHLVKKKQHLIVSVFYFLIFFTVTTTTAV